MAVESQILINNYGVNEEFATTLLNFTKNDVEGSIRILEAAERDVFVLKAKFISSRKMVYGAVVLFYNFQFNIPQYVFCSMSSDINLSRIRIDGDWRDFITEITRFMEGKEAEFELASRIESEILSPENIAYITAAFADRSNIDQVNLKRFLLNSLSKVLLDNQIVFKLTMAELDVFKFNNYFNNTSIGLKIVPKQGIKDIMLVNLKIDPVLAPIGRLDIEKTHIGDEIMVKIMDDRDVSRYIGELIGARDESGIPRPVFGRVANNQKSPETGNNLLNLQFGPGIFGSFVIGSKVRVEIKDRDNRPEAPPQGGQKPGLDEDSMRQIRELGGVGVRPTGVSPMPSLDSFSVPQRKKAENKNAKFYKIVSFVVMGIAVLIIILLVIFGT